MANAGEKLSVGLVFDDTLDSSDGVAGQVKVLGEWLGAQGHRVSYFCGQTNMDNWASGKVYSLSRNIQVRFNGNRMSIPLFSSTARLKRALVEARPDVLHIMVPYSPMMSGKLIRLANSTPIVGTFHILPAGWLARAGSRLLGIVQHFSLKRFSAFMSVSKSAAVFSKQFYKIDSTVVPNMIKPKVFEPGRSISPKAGRIVFLGRLVPRKGCQQLIETFAELANDLPKVELVIAGDGQERQNLESLARQLGIADKVKFLGFVSDQQRAEILASATVACFPALGGESFGVVLIEAMAAGSGVVLAGDNPGYGSVMEDQPQLLIDPKNTQAFSRRLYTLLTDASLRQKMHDWQTKHVKHYDVTVVGPQILEIYAKAIAKSREQPHN